ncbi:MAG TPA: alpha/beta fold hydrolase [Gemmataceae bacterium]|nr:alpha/beta fold hydrolase [Gemmataceae bacterium]
MICIAFTGRPARGDQPQPPAQTTDPAGVVFAVNGSGNLQFTSTALEKAVADACLPLTVVTVDWSQGSVVADHTDWQHAQEEGCRLAEQITAYHQAHPSQAIFLVAHSAGSGVALTAAAAVPPGSVNRIILLAPSVSTDYDLRPALRGSRDGMDVFYSRRDVFSLGFAVRFVGTSDGGQGCQAAGRVGFQTQSETTEDDLLFAKLRQHPWDRCQARAGNPGFHSGARRARFLHSSILPLLDPDHLAAN